MNTYLEKADGKRRENTKTNINRDVKLSDVLR